MVVKRLMAYIFIHTHSDIQTFTHIITHTFTEYILFYKQEVILVDDASTHAWLKEPLELYLSHLPKVRLVRQKEREGLIRSRMKGYRMAEGPVVIFQVRYHYQ